jgi:tetratricopeptide (TPR) repeat protein
MDWGLAKVLGARPAETADPDETTAGTRVVSVRDSDGLLTQAGSVLGTPAFMPPEQAAGAVGKVDRRSDVFGLGAILAVILTGRPPFEGASPETARVRAAQGDVADCLARLDGCGAEPELVALCKRCLSPRQDDRPADAGEVAKAVAELRAAADERARRAELERVRADGERAKIEAEAREQRKRRRLQAALGVAVLAAVALASFGLWWEERRTGNLERERTAARDAAHHRLQGALDRVASAFVADRLADADAALQRADELLDAADAPDLRTRFEDLRADQAMVAELDRVWARANAIVDDRVPGAMRRAGGLRFDEEAARTGYPSALAARGLTLADADLAGVADQVARSAVRDRLIAALDDWLPVAAPEDRPRLCDLLARVDPDPDRNEVRRAHAEPDRLKTLFARRPAEGALRVAARAANSPAVPDAAALAVLRAAAVRYPDDFRTQYAAGLRTHRADRVEAAGYYRAAAALRPDNLAAVYGLGFALDQAGRPGEAALHYLRAIELDPGFGSACLNLADAIKRGADPAPAVAYFEREIGRNANPAMAHFGLGMALRDRDPGRAAAEFRQSLTFDGAFAMTYNYLGYVLDGTANRDERVRCYKRAIELDPTFAFPHYNLGNTLLAGGDVTGAVAEFQEAIRLFPEFVFSHLSLAVALRRQNDRPGAIKHLRRVIEINPNLQDAYFRLGQILLEDDAAGAVDLYRACVQRFPTWFVGYDGLVLALGRKGAHVEAVKVYQGAMLQVDQTWPPSARGRLRYNAACSAALAGTGAGKDPPPPTDRWGWRQQALAWLRAELTSIQMEVESRPAARGPAQAVLKHWLADPDLSGVRDPEPLAKLPGVEREEWEKFWADVKATIAEARKPPPDGKPPTPPAGAGKK